MDEWMHGWVDGWMDVKAVLMIAYSNKKFCNTVNNAGIVSKQSDHITMQKANIGGGEKKHKLWSDHILEMCCEN